MQVEAFLTEIENLCSSFDEANDAKNGSAKEANKKGLKQSRASAMILDFHLWHLKKHANRSNFGCDRTCVLYQWKANDAKNNTTKEVNEQDLNQSRSSAMILDFHLWHLKKIMQIRAFFTEKCFCSSCDEANDPKNDNANANKKSLKQSRSSAIRLDYSFVTFTKKSCKSKHFWLR